MNQTSNKLKRLKKDCKKYSYRYKRNFFWRQRWIDNYDIVTCIKLLHQESDNNKLTTEVLINLEVQIDNMTRKLGKSQPWKAFEIIINTAIKASKAA